MSESFEENNPADIEVDFIFSDLQKIFPDLQKSHIQFYYHGTYNVFNILGQEKPYILRIPDKAFRNTQGVELIRRETKLLSHFQSHFSYQIPKPKYFSLNPEIPFMINRKIPGISLSRVYDTLEPQKIQHIGKSIGHFLSELHSEETREVYFQIFPQAKEEMINFCANYRKYWSDFYQKIQTTLYPLFSSSQQAWLNQVFSSFLDQPENFHFIPTISHGDFDTSNILVDPEKGVLTGIIDFEECRLYDPAADLLFFNEGSSFLEAILQSRAKYLKNKKNSEEINNNEMKTMQKNSLRNRMQFLFSRTCLAYIEWGVDHDRPDMIKAGFKIMENNQKIFPMEENE